MDRLTEREGNRILLKGTRICAEDKQRGLTPALNAIIRLAAYEDTGIAPEEVKALASAHENDPLTIEQLREMDGEPVWMVRRYAWGEWALVDVEREVCRTAKEGTATFETYGKAWNAYRLKPEDVTK